MWRATLPISDGWLVVFSGVAMVTPDHDRRLEKLAKGDRCGHSPVFDYAQRLENPGAHACHQKRRGEGRSKSVGNPEKAPNDCGQTPRKRAEKGPTMCIPSQNTRNTSHVVAKRTGSDHNNAEVM